MSEPIAIIPKNANEKIHIGLDQYQKHNLAFIRIYYNSGDADWRPTKKGLSVKVTLLNDVIQGLEKAREQAQKVGWL